MYMDWAHRCSDLSYARRAKVGAVIVKDDSVISYGYNGMPAGWDNNCEDELSWPNGEVRHLKTKPEVLHAEMNSLLKLAKTHNSGQGSTMFITHSPCIECAKGILQAGISNIYYAEPYRDTAGVEFLTKSNISVNQYIK